MHLWATQIEPNEDWEIEIKSSLLEDLHLMISSTYGQFGRWKLSQVLSGIRSLGEEEHLPPLVFLYPQVMMA